MRQAAGGAFIPACIDWREMPAYNLWQALSGLYAAATQLDERNRAMGILPQSKKTSRRLPRDGAGRPQSRAARLVKNIITVPLCLGAAMLIAELFYRLGLGPQNAILVFVLAIFLVAVLTDGYIYCICAVILGTFAFDFLITTPRLDFSYTIGFPVTLVIMLLVALITASITARMRQMAKHAMANEHRAGLLYEINDRLLSAYGLAAIAREANGFAAQYLQRSSCIYWMTAADADAPAHAYPHAAPEDMPPDRFDDALLRAHAAAMRDAQDEQTLASPPMALYRFYLDATACGVLAISLQRGSLTADDRWFIRLLAGQLDQALQVETLRQERQQALVSAETEKARNKFLRAISHDLRTPLTGIIGASSVLMEDGGRLKTDVCQQLSADIHDDAVWLLNMVQNILSTTRMQADGVIITKNVEVMEEVIANAVTGIRKRFPGCRIQVVAPEHLVMVSMDAMLISQVISNLLENALRHAGKPDPQVMIALSEMDDYACVTVTDDGAGLPEALLPTLFDQPAAAIRSDESVDTSRGFGMGLSLCKTIVEAHQGSIEGCNLPGGGAMIRFCLPMRKDA